MRDESWLFHHKQMLYYIKMLLPSGKILAICDKYLQHIRSDLSPLFHTNAAWYEQCQINPHLWTSGFVIEIVMIVKWNMKSSGAKTAKRHHKK